MTLMFNGRPLELHRAIGTIIAEETGCRVMWDRNDFTRELITSVTPAQKQLIFDRIAELLMAEEVEHSLSAGAQS